MFFCPDLKAARLRKAGCGRINYPEEYLSERRIKASEKDCRRSSYYQLFYVTAWLRPLSEQSVA
jgi:hypothetical protein